MRARRRLVVSDLTADAASAGRPRVLPFGRPTRRTGPLTAEAVRRVGLATRVVFPAPRSERAAAVVFAAVLRVVAVLVPRAVKVRAPVLRVTRAALRPAVAEVAARAVVARRVAPVLDFVAATFLVVLAGVVGRPALSVFARGVVARVRVAVVLARDFARVDRPGLDFAAAVRDVFGAARLPAVVFVTAALLRGVLVVAARAEVFLAERPLAAADVRAPRAVVRVVVRTLPRAEVVRRPPERIAIALETALLSKPAVLALDSSLLI